MNWNVMSSVWKQGFNWCIKVFKRNIFNNLPKSEKSIITQKNIFPNNWKKQQILSFNIHIILFNTTTNNRSYVNNKNPTKKKKNNDNLFYSPSFPSFAKSVGEKSILWTEKNKYKTGGERRFGSESFEFEFSFPHSLP